MIIIWIILAIVVISAVAGAIGGGEQGSSPRAPAAPTAAPAAPAPPVSITLDGGGTEVWDVSLPSGQYTAQISVINNQDCSYGSCLDDNFIVEVQSVSDGATELLANEIAKTWKGTVTFRVGSGLFDLSPGDQLISVDASGDWEIVLTRK